MLKFKSNKIKLTKRLVRLKTAFIFLIFLLNSENLYPKYINQHGSGDNFIRKETSENFDNVDCFIFM